MKINKRLLTIMLSFTLLTNSLNIVYAGEIDPLIIENSTNDQVLQSITDEFIPYTAIGSSGKTELFCQSSYNEEVKAGSKLTNIPTYLLNNYSVRSDGSTLNDHIKKESGDSDYSKYLPNFDSLINLSEGSTPEQVEIALRKAGLFSVPDGVTVQENGNQYIKGTAFTRYGKTGMAERVYLGTNFFTYGIAMYNNLGTLTSGIVTSGVNEEGTPIILLRTADSSLSSGTPEFRYDSVRWYDITLAIQSASDMLSTQSEKYHANNYPLTKILVDAYSDISGSYLEGLKARQSELFEIFKTQGKDHNHNKATTTKFNDYVVSGKIEGSLPDVQYTNNPDHQASMINYYNALEISHIFEARDYTYSDNINEDTLQDYYVPYEERAGKSKLDVLKEANAVADEYKSKYTMGYTDKGMKSNAGLFYDISRYRLGKLLNASERSDNSIESDGRQVEPKLDALLVTKEDLKNIPINPLLFEQFSVMKLPKEELSIDETLGLFASLQLLEEWVNNVEVSGVGDDLNNPKNQVLEDLLTADYEKSDEDLKPLSGDKGKLVRSYVQIHKGLEFLGVEPWTARLKYVFDLASKFDRYTFDTSINEYDPTSDSEPLKRFFSLDEGVISNQYFAGVALSSTYIPMQTNLYDSTSVRVLKDESWLRDFHIKYGFYRKALYIDTNVNAAVDRYITESRGSVKVATLNDLLQHEKDIVLYVDDNFYNADKLNDVISNFNARIEDGTSRGVNMKKMLSSSPESLLKTDSIAEYDKDVHNAVYKYGERVSETTASSFDSVLFNDTSESKDIQDSLNEDEYTVEQPYAVVSGIYRDVDLFDTLNSYSENPEPVFISSPTLYNVQGIKEYDFGTIYNYYMLRNLESAMGVDYKTTLDLDNPIYIDIYGNIVTESGLVVIPAASNATLYPKDTYLPYTIGFMSLYSNGDNISDNKNENITKYLKDFTWVESKGVWLQKNYMFDNVLANPQTPSVADEALLNVLYDMQMSLMQQKAYKPQQRYYLITEVLRGAPLENIEKEKEGLGIVRNTSKYGLYTSWKLDDLSNNLLPTTNGNSIVSMPNIAFIEGFEYIVLFLYKIIILLFVVYLLYRIYIDTVGGMLGLKTILSTLGSVIMIIICLVTVPDVISISYDATNKFLLQNEVKYINLLNYEKSLEGREISAIEVNEPQTQTKLYLKLDDLNIPWYELVDDVMLSPVGTTITDLYEEEITNHPLYGFSGVQILNNGVYIDIADIFESSSIVYNNNMKFLYQSMNDNPTASFYLPYYYFLDSLISQINIYNKENGIVNITTKIQSDGSVKTMGMIGDYLLSEYFLTQTDDPLSLKYAYIQHSNEYNEFSNTLDSDDMNSLGMSLWYSRDYYKDEVIQEKINEIYDYMRAYVAENRHMIGRVTDETFLKAMCLDLAIKHNDLFRVPAARNVEVFSIDSRDLIRLSMSDRGVAVTNASLSFGRFVFEQSGILGVILCAFLIVIYFITSVVKPLFVFFIFTLIIYNMLIKGITDKTRTKVVEGLLFVLSIMVIVNSFYALLLKLSMLLPKLGVNPTISLLGQICIQLFYLFMVLMVFSMITKDIRNMGYNAFASKLHVGNLSIEKLGHAITDRFVYTPEQQRYMNRSQYYGDKSGSAVDMLKEMYMRDQKYDSSNTRRGIVGNNVNRTRVVIEDKDGNVSVIDEVTTRTSHNYTAKQIRSNYEDIMRGTPTDKDDSVKNKTIEDVRKSSHSKSIFDKD